MKINKIIWNIITIDKDWEIQKLSEILFEVSQKNKYTEINVRKYLVTVDTPTVCNRDPWGKDGTAIISADSSCRSKTLY